MRKIVVWLSLVVLMAAELCAQNSEDGCQAPSRVSVYHVTEREATVSWQGMANTYHVLYRAEGAWSWNLLVVDGVDSAVIAPLEDATRYEVCVQTLCPALESTPTSDTVSFVTDLCGNNSERHNFRPDKETTLNTASLVQTQYAYSYCEVLVDSATLSGISSIDALTFYVTKVGAGACLTDCDIYMGHTTASTLSRFQYNNTYTLVYNGDLSFHGEGPQLVHLPTPYAWDGHGNIVVGIMYRTPTGDTYDTIGFAAHRSATPHVCFSHCPARFTPAEANRKSFAIEPSVLVPDLTFHSCLPVCHKPVLRSVSATATSVSLDWHNENAAVELAIKPLGAMQWSDPVIVNTGHRHTFSGLDGMTTYNVCLRRVCNGDYSDWTETTVSTDTICSTPTALSATNITTNTVTIDWLSDNSLDHAWEVHVWGDAFNRFYDVTQHPTTITDLTPHATYHAAVRAYCGSDNHVVGAYSQELSFDNICYPPVRLEADVVEGRVELSWEGGYRNQMWRVSYGLPGFAETEQLGYMTVGSPSAIISDLAPGQAYAFRVSAVCGEGWQSAWSDEVVATVDGVGVGDIADNGAQVTLIPNLANDRVTLYINGYDGISHISIFSRDGKRVYDAENNVSKFEIDISSLQPDMYYFKVQLDSSFTVHKLKVI